MRCRVAARKDGEAGAVTVCSGFVQLGDDGCEEAVTGVGDAGAQGIDGLKNPDGTAVEDADAV